MDVKNLLDEKETHNQTPLGMAKFQQRDRGRSRKDVIDLLEQMMPEYAIHASAE
jgi:hypothetical protein